MLTAIFSHAGICRYADSPQLFEAIWRESQCLFDERRVIISQPLH